MKCRRSKGRSRLCIHHDQPGRPELHYFPKVTILTAEGPMTMDALVRARRGDRVVWLALEIDEDRAPSAESLRRESILPIPTIRVTPGELLRSDFVDRLFDHIETHLRDAA